MQSSYSLTTLRSYGVFIYIYIYVPFGHSTDDKGALIFIYKIICVPKINGGLRELEPHEGN